MDLSSLGFLGEPWFVVPWYAIGALGVLSVIYGMRVNNTVIKPAIGWGDPSSSSSRPSGSPSASSPHERRESGASR